MADETTARQGAKEEPKQHLGILDIAAIFLNQGAMSLGMIPNPMTGEPFASFEAAQESISILEVLREKTEGNLSEEESRSLTQMVDELKMLFVHAVSDPKVKELAEKSKAAGKKSEPSKIITPDGRPSSAATEKPTIILP